MQFSTLLSYVFVCAVLAAFRYSLPVLKIYIHIYMHVTYITDYVTRDP